MNAHADDRSSVTMMETRGPSAAYKLFEQAMSTRKQILCTYNGRPRELCPVILGHSQGQEKALTYQFRGQSAKGLLERLTIGVSTLSPVPTKYTGPCSLPGASFAGTRGRARLRTGSRHRDGLSPFKAASWPVGACRVDIEIDRFRHSLAAGCGCHRHAKVHREY